MTSFFACQKNDFQRIKNNSRKNSLRMNVKQQQISYCPSYVSIVLLLFDKGQNITKEVSYK